MSTTRTVTLAEGTSVVCTLRGSGERNCIIPEPFREEQCWVLSLQVAYDHDGEPTGAVLQMDEHGDEEFSLHLSADALETLAISAYLALAGPVAEAA